MNRLTTPNFPSDLLTLMGDIQKRRYGDDWPYGSEVVLWHEAVTGDTEDGRKLLQLATLADGWWRWSDDENRMLWVNLDVWRVWMLRTWRAA